MPRAKWTGLFCLLLALFGAAPMAWGQNAKLCIESNFGKPLPATLFVKPDEITAQIKSIADFVGFNEKIEIVPCSLTDMIEAYSAEVATAKIPAGNYIIYKDTWIKHVIYKDTSQLEAVLIHEIGHLLHRDFTEARKADKSQRERETEADILTGCTIGKMKRQFAAWQEILERVRSQNDSPEAAHPGAAVSIAHSLEAFLECGGAPSKPAELAAVATMALNRVSAREWSSVRQEDILEKLFAEIQIDHLRAASDSDPRAALALGWALTPRDGSPVNWPSAIRYWRLAVARGNARASNALGTIYERGLRWDRDRVDVPVNTTTARAYYSVAAEGRNAYGEYNLARVLLNRPGVSPEDKQRAIELLKAAADQGINAAIGLLAEQGVIYSEPVNPAPP